MDPLNPDKEVAVLGTVLGYRKNIDKSTSKNLSKGELIIKINPGDMPKGQVPKMENPPPPPKKD